MTSKNISKASYGRYLREGMLDGFPAGGLSVAAFEDWPFHETWGNVFSSIIKFGAYAYDFQLGWNPNDEEKLPTWSLHRNIETEPCEYNVELKCVLHSLAYIEDTKFLLQSKRPKNSEAPENPLLRTSNHAKALANLVIERLVADLLSFGIK